MNRIKFSYNWNKKLGCNAYTTIRLKNPAKYKVGEQYEIFLKNGKGWDQLANAKIVEIKEMRFSQINNYIAYLDTGYNVRQCKRVIQLMYKKVFEKDPNPVLYFILLTSSIHFSEV